MNDLMERLLDGTQVPLFELRIAAHDRIAAQAAEIARLTADVALWKQVKEAVELDVDREYKRAETAEAQVARLTAERDGLAVGAQWARNRLNLIADEAWHGDGRDLKRSIIGVFADFDEALSDPAKYAIARAGVAPLGWCKNENGALDCAIVDSFGLYQITDENVLFIGHDTTGRAFGSAAEAMAAAEADFAGRMINRRAYHVGVAVGKTSALEPSAPASDAIACPIDAPAHWQDGEAGQ